MDETNGDAYVAKAKTNNIAIISQKSRSVTQLPWKNSVNQIAWAVQSGTFLNGAAFFPSRWSRRAS